MLTFHPPLNWTRCWELRGSIGMIPITESELEEMLTETFRAKVHSALAQLRCERISERHIEAAPETKRSK